MPPWLSLLAMKGIQLPTKGQGRNKGLLDSVTPKLIRPPCRDAAPTSTPRPLSLDETTSRLEDLEQRSAKRHEEIVDRLHDLEQRNAKRHEEIVERLQMFQQRSEEILKFLASQLC